MLVASDGSTVGKHITMEVPFGGTHGDVFNTNECDIKAEMELGGHDIALLGAWVEGDFGYKDSEGNTVHGRGHNVTWVCTTGGPYVPDVVPEAFRAMGVVKDESGALRM